MNDNNNNNCNNNTNQLDYELYNRNNNVSIQNIILYKLSQASASIVKYTSLLLNCLQELINNLLNLQTTYPIATNKSLSIIFLKEFINVNTDKDKKYETCGNTYEVCNCFLEYTNFKDDLIEYKYFYVVTRIISKSLTEN